LSKSLSKKKKVCTFLRHCFAVLLFCTAADRYLSAEQSIVIVIVSGEDAKDGRCHTFIERFTAPTNNDLVQRDCCSDRIRQKTHVM